MVFLSSICFNGEGKRNCGPSKCLLQATIPWCEWTLKTFKGTTIPSNTFVSSTGKHLKWLNFKYLAAQKIPNTLKIFWTLLFQIAIPPYPEKNNKVFFQIFLSAQIYPNAHSYKWPSLLHNNKGFKHIGNENMISTNPTFPVLSASSPIIHTVSSKTGVIWEVRRWIVRHLILWVFHLKQQQKPLQWIYLQYHQCSGNYNTFSL